MPKNGSKNERMVEPTGNLATELGPCLRQVNPDIIKSVVNENGIQVHNLPPKCVDAAAAIIDNKGAQFIIVDESTIEVPRASKNEYAELQALIKAYESGKFQQQQEEVDESSTLP